MSDATIREMPEPEQKKPVSHLAVRFLLLVVTTLQMAFVVLATVLIVSGTNQHGDGKEYAAVALAIMLLEIPFTIPAFILAVRGKALGIATCLAGFATFADVMFWIQLYAEVTTRGVEAARDVDPRPRLCAGRGASCESDSGHSALKHEDYSL